jgi:hypothetical protein
MMPHRCAIAIVISLASASGTSAIQIYMSDPPAFCDFHSTIYAVNEEVYVCGDWDEYDFPSPIGDILPLGEYDVVMDENRDGIFSGGAYPDLALGNGPSAAFSVVDAYLPERVNVDSIKTAALDNAQAWAASGFAMGKGLTWAIGNIGNPGLEFDYLFDTAVEYVPEDDIPYIGVANYLGHPPQQSELELSLNPLDYYKYYLLCGVYMIEQVAYSQTEVYFDIHQDPPDPNFDEVVRLEPIAIVDAIGPGPDHYLHINLVRTLREETALGLALRQAYEKFLGAAPSAASYGWAKIQNEAIIEYAGLFRESVDSAIALTGDLQAWASNLGVGGAAHNADSLALFQSRIATIGFTTAELDSMDSLGMQGAEIDSLKTIILGVDPNDFAGITVAGSIDSLTNCLTRTSGGLSAMIESAEVVRSLLSNIGIEHPTASITAPQAVPEGAPATLSGGGSSDPQQEPLTFAWDLDADGLFDDAVGPDVQHTWMREGPRLVGLEVTDPGGHQDVAYARLMVSEINDGPSVVSAEPSLSFIEADSTVNPIPFSVLADDPEGGPLSYEWFVDGESTGQTEPLFAWELTPGVHVVRVVISDGSPLSPDMRWVWRVRHIADGIGINDGDGGTNGRRSRLILRQPSPNPFNSSTRISFELPSDGDVRIQVHDALGRLIRTLVRNRRVAGRHAVEWDGRDDRGRAVVSGVYYLRLRTASQTVSQKVVLVR